MSQYPHRLLVITAPIAGGDGPSALDGVGKSVDLTSLKVRRLGTDVALEGEIA